MITHSEEDGYKILDGRRVFRSAFCHPKRKVRNRAHRRLHEELRARGYYPNGRKLELPELPEKPELDPDKMNWDDFDPKQFFAGSMAALQALADSITKIEDREPTTFHQNLETGNVIPLDVLMAAILLWPLEEVLEMIPEQPAYDVAEKLGQPTTMVSVDINALRKLANNE